MKRFRCSAGLTPGAIFAAVLICGPISSWAQPAPPTVAVEPGYLGVMADDLPDGTPGIQLLDVLAGGPGQIAGLQLGDIITSIDGKTAAKVDDMATLLAGRPAGDQVTFVIRRGNEVRRVEVRLGTRPAADARRYENFGRVPPQTIPPQTVAPNPLPTRLPNADTPNAGTVSEPLPLPVAPVPGSSTTARVSPIQPAQPIQPLTQPPVAIPPYDPANPPVSGGMLLGVRAVPVSPEIQKALALPHARGALVVEVRPNSPAQEAGLPLEAVITEVDGKRVDSPTELADMVKVRGHGAVVRLSYYRFGQLQEKTIRLGGGAPAPVPVVPSAPSAVFAPAVVPTPPPISESETDALRRQIRELETRLKELEQSKPAVPPAKAP